MHRCSVSCSGGRIRFEGSRSSHLFRDEWPAREFHVTIISVPRIRGLYQYIPGFT
jgi:hypothetical protein